MKGLFSAFALSAKEFTKLRTLTVTAMMIAVSMLIEMFAIDVGFIRLNFAFIAIAVIGMLFGPCVGLTAGLACDIVGHLAHPVGAFLPAYTLAAGLQGLIYGMLLYYKIEWRSAGVTKKKQLDITLMLRIVIARLLDIVVINLLINTALNLHYGFIPEEAYSTAIVARVAKNVLELVIDLPLLFVVLPAVLAAYKRVFRMRTNRAQA
ncbi:MAG: folate family ECF transporter S component [Ruminococcus sp.]|nr:folate family ECF transporter S component [Ruminococcus sp.]